MSNYSDIENQNLNWLKKQLFWNLLMAAQQVKISSQFRCTESFWKKLIGEPKALSLLLQTKDSVARAGPSPLSQLWRALISYELVNFFSWVSNSLLTVPVVIMVIMDVREAVLTQHTYIQTRSRLNLLLNIHILEWRAVVCTRKVWDKLKRMASAWLCQTVHLKCKPQSWKDQSLFLLRQIHCISKLILVEF